MTVDTVLTIFPPQMPVAQASLNNLRPSGYTFTAKDTANGHLVQSSPLVKMREAQVVLHKIITGAVKWYDGQEVIDIPAREIASCSVALCKVEERIRLNLGKANPAPIKSEPKRGKRSSGALRPAFVEQVQVQPEPIPPTV